jgi:hypothetical protein
MVQNTVGRIYLDNNPYCPLKKDWKYLVEPTEKTPKEAILNIDNLEDLTLADLACGSGHILVEGFDLLYSLYIDEGYSRYDAVKNIFTKNLTGIDLDTRAKQLATFALLLKAAQIDPKFLDGEIMPRVFDMPNVDRYTWRDLNGHMATALQIEGPNQQIYKEIDECFTLMEQAQNLGSIMKFNISDATRGFIKQCVEEQNRQHKFEDQFADLFHGFNIILALTEKYATLAMNPPYMGGGNMNPILSDYVKKNYEEGKADLFSTFMLLAIERLDNKGKYGMINMHSWMFLSSFEKLRRSLLDNYHIDSLLHLGARTFDELSGEVVQNAAFVVSKARIEVFLKAEAEYSSGEKSQSIRSGDTVRKEQIENGTYFRLVDGRNCADKERLFLNAKNLSKIYYPNVGQEKFKMIPNCNLGYWASENMKSIFKQHSAINSFGRVTLGMRTGDNNRFLRLWYEVSFAKAYCKAKTGYDAIVSKAKWFPYNKGGEFRKWYGNLEYFVNWEKDGFEIKENTRRVYPQLGDDLGWKITSEDKYFHQGIAWSRISSSNFGVRQANNLIFDTAAPMFFPENSDVYDFLTGFMCTKVAGYILNILNPTLTFQVGDVAKVPVVLSNNNKQQIDNYVTNNVNISKSDWDSHETSWDFDSNPLLELSGAEIEEEGEIVDLSTKSDLLELQVKQYKAIWEQNFYQLHKN